MRETEYKIGDIFYLIVNYENTPCIILDIKNYREFITPKTKSIQFFLPGNISYWSLPLESPFNTPDYHKNEICYELLCGDDKAWFMQNNLLGQDLLP